MVWTAEIWRWGCWDRRAECSRRWIWRWIWSVWREIWEGGFEWRRRIWFLRIETRWPLCCVCCASLFYVRARERKREQAREREVFGFSDVDWELRRGRRWRRRRRTFFYFFWVCWVGGEWWGDIWPLRNFEFLNYFWNFCLKWPKYPIIFHALSLSLSTLPCFLYLIKFNSLI